MSRDRYRNQPRSRVLAQQRRRELTARLRSLKTGPCKDCGGIFDPVCMDFDHRPDEAKLFDIASVGGKRRNWDTVLAEIEKCDLICSNCHRLRTFRKRDHAATCEGKVRPAIASTQFALDLKPP